MTNNRKWIITFAIFVILVTSIPYLIGFMSQGTDWRFSGFVFGVEDGNSYIGKMLRGASGDWLFRSPYTVYSQNGLFAFIPYLLLGKLASPPGMHDQLVAIFQLFRCFAVFLVILATYDLIGHFIKEEKNRRAALVLATLGGGAGWLILFFIKGTSLNSLPLEFYSPESFGFLEILGLPHLAMARALLFWGLCKYLSTEDPVSARKNGILGGVLWLGAGLFQPLAIATGWMLLAAHQLVMVVLNGIKAKKMNVNPEQLPSFTTAVWMGLISSPIVIYSLVASNTDSYFKLWTGQNLILSPNPLYYLAAYGILISFVIGEIFHIFKVGTGKGIFLAAWIITFPIMAYLPYNLQRRLPEGIWVALVIAAISLWERYKWSERKWIWAFYSIQFPSTIIILAGAIQAASQPASPIFLPIAEIKAFNYFSEHSMTNGIVMADYEIANALPAWAAEYVLLGHGPESVRYEHYASVVAAIWNPETNATERERLLSDNRIDTIIYGPDEQAEQAWNPISCTSCERVYDQAGYQIFHYDQPGTVSQ